MQSSFSANSPVAKLKAAAAAIDGELKHLPLARDYISSDSTSRTPITQTKTRQLLNDLEEYWDAQINGVERHAVLASLYGQALDAQVQMQVEDGELHRDFLPCVAVEDDRVVSHSLFIKTDQSKVLVAGVLVLIHEDGRTLKYVPGHGAEGFNCVTLMTEALTGQLNDPALREGLLRHIAQPARNALIEMATDEEQFDDPFDSTDLVLVPMENLPYEQIIWGLQTRQEADVIHALAPRAGDTDQSQWLERVDQAIQMSGLLGLDAQLNARNTRLAIRQYSAQLPDWYKVASHDARARLHACLEYSSQTSAALDDALGGTASLEQYASLQLQDRIANDLGLDIDPGQVMISVTRALPRTGEAYLTTRSLTDQTIKGLHPGDELPGSAFLTDSVITLGDQPLPASHTSLTPDYVASMIDALQIRASFSQVQRSSLAKLGVRPLIRQAIEAQLMTQSWLAQMQGHITAQDYALIEELDRTPQASVTGPVTVQQIKLNGDALLGNILVLRVTDEEGQLARLLMFTPDIPREQKVQAFDSEKHLLVELVGWTRSPALREYILDNTQASYRPALSATLLQLNSKPLPAADFITLVQAGAGNFNDGLHALADLKVSLLLDGQTSHSPDWYIEADKTQRQQLLALGDAVKGAIGNYEAKTHTVVVEYADYVHQRATEKICHLLEQVDGTVDPDQIIITTPRETLTYTQMLRDGYDDTLGFFNGTADTTATFSGPEGLDLTPLTPEKVALSVRGSWLNDAYIDLVRSTLLAPESDGYQYRRAQSVLVTQLSMEHAALISLLKGQIDQEQYRWLSYTINTLSVQACDLRARCPVYALEIPAEEPGIEFYYDTRQERGLPNPGSLKVETVQGCYIVPPKDSDNPQAQALLYTPAAPDGLAFRPLSTFVETLQNEGMGDYYKDRCRLMSGRDIAFALHRLKTDPYPNPVILPRQPHLIMGDVCFDQPLLNKIRDIEDTSIGRSDMIEGQIWNAVDLLAISMTLWFPAASFAVGAAMAVRDGVRAIQALENGDHETASMHVLGAWLNAAGAAGDAVYGLKGMGKVLKHSVSPSVAKSSAGSTIESVTTLPVALNGEPYWLGASTYNSHTQLLRKNIKAPDALLPSGRYAHKHANGTWSASESAALPASGSVPANPAFEVRISLDDATPAEGIHAQGVARLNGKHYVTVENKVFEVHFDAHARHWNIVNPDNPFAFFGKQPVMRNTQGEWSVMKPAALRGGMGGHSRLPADAATTTQPQISERLTRFHCAQEHKARIHLIMDTQRAREALKSADMGDEAISVGLLPVIDEFAVLRSNLYQAADEFFQAPPMAPKPDLPQMDGSISPDEFFQNAFANHRALVISEMPSAVGSKKFLIENMEALRRQGVEVIYLRSLLSDVHSAKLHKYQAKTLKKGDAGSLNIKSFLKDFETQHHGVRTVDGLDYYHVIKHAHMHGIEVKALTSSVSYDLPNSVPVAAAATDPHAAKKMSTFFANEVIEVDKLAHPERRWVALLDHKQANMHERLPGIAELQGAVSVRIEDVAINSPLRISRDIPVEGRTIIHADFALEVASPDIVAGAAGAAAVPQPAVLATKLDEELFTLIEGMPPSIHTPVKTRRGSNAFNHYRGDYGFELDTAGHWRRTTAKPQQAPELIVMNKPVPDAEFEIPQDLVEDFHNIHHYVDRGLHRQYEAVGAEARAIKQMFFERQEKLSAVAKTNHQAALAERPMVPQIPEDATAPQMFDRLYEQFNGVIIGEPQPSILGKKLIIDNVEHLAETGVKTLYMEGLMSDIHQADLDRFFETGFMSKRLLRDIKEMDQGISQTVSGVYNLENLVIKARQHGIEVRALDCAASLVGESNDGFHNTTRDILFSVFASRVITRHQQAAEPHKWLALMDQFHANSRAQGPNGIAEQQQAVAVRLADAKPGEGRGVSVDNGERVSRRTWVNKAFVKNDVKLQLGFIQPPSAAVKFGPKLKEPHMFLIDDRVPHRPVIVYHSGTTKMIETYPVHFDGEGRAFIDADKWHMPITKRFDDLPHIIKTLERMSLVRVEA